MCLFPYITFVFSIIFYVTQSSLKPYTNAHTLQDATLMQVHVRPSFMSAWTGLGPLV